MSTLKDFPPIIPELHEAAQLNWICGPCGQSRDSDALERANFDVACERLLEVDPGERDHEVISWKHWAVGWIDEIFVRPGSRADGEREIMVEALENYPCLDEDRLAQYEVEDDEANDQPTEIVEASDVEG